MNLSHSRIRCFLECPWRYKKLYLEGHKGEPVPAFEVGKTLHSLVHHYGEHCYAKGFGEDEAQAEAIAGETDDAQAQKQFLFWARQHTWDFEGLIGRTGALFETWHEMEFGEDLFRARIDLCRWEDRDAGMLYVCDWKSGGYHYPPQPEECPIQLRLYALVMARELGEQVDTVHARIEFLGGCLNWSYDLGGEDFFKTEEWLRTTVALMKREETFLAEPGSHCMNCSCRSVCEYGYSSPIDALLTNQLIEELDMLNAKREAYQEALRNRVEQHGPHTDRRGREWGWHEGKECYEVKDPAAYAAARREAKLKPWAFCAWNQSALRRDANREPLRELLEEKLPERRWGAKFLKDDTNGASPPEEGE